jgi:hypothetical protein
MFENFILQSAIQYVDAQKPLRHAGCIQIVGHDIFDERAAAWTALDVDCKSLGVGKLTMLDPDVANAAGRLAADSDAREN